MSTRVLRFKWTSSYYRVGRDDAIRVRIAVTYASGITDHVFAYRMMPVNPQTGEMVGVFSHVCSPVDLADFPAETPIPGNAPEWFRLAFVDVLLRSTAEAFTFVQAVREDLARLRNTLDRTDLLVPGGEEDAMANGFPALGIGPPGPTGPPGPAGPEGPSGPAGPGAFLDETAITLLGRGDSVAGPTEEIFLAGWSEMVGTTFKPRGPLMTADIGGPTIIEMAASNRYIITLSASATLAVNGVGVGDSFMLWIRGQTSGYTLDWWDGVLWAGGSLPTIPVINGRVMAIGFTRLGSDEYWASAAPEAY